MRKKINIGLLSARMSKLVEKYENIIGFLSLEAIDAMQKLITNGNSVKVNTVIFESCVCMYIQ